ncbi:MAG TPA: alpha/beta hydrolase [Sphingomonas sp.]|jgi:pimeloyl-ACP methyl ester carboxylesterase
MPGLITERVPLPTGVELDVAVAGPRDAPPVILLHGFPESHRTWRSIVPDLGADRFILAPDQRGYARSSKPPRVEDYAPDRIVADLIALADHYGLDRFTLVGHDWGGAIAWMAALRHPERVAKLVILNAPHPYVFQRTLFDDPAQRAASQYIRRFRDTSLDKGLVGAGLERFFGSTFAHVLTTGLAGEDKAAYLDEWAQPGAITAMLNWYRASAIVVPSTGEEAERPAFLDAPFPPVTQPTLVIWGMDDHALLPVQIETLHHHALDLTVERIDGAGHFVTWEKPAEVIAAMRRWGI